MAELVDFARSNGYQIVAIQQSAGSVPYHQANYPPKPLFVVGSEDAGMQAALRLAADLMVEIPQYGLIDSLNVATAATVVLFHWRVHAPTPLSESVTSKSAVILIASARHCSVVPIDYRR